MGEETKIEFCLRETYLAAIRNCDGDTSYRDAYAKVNGTIKNITEGGINSCANVVTSIQIRFGFVSKVHTTIDGTIEDMLTNGWYKIKGVRNGAVIVYEKKLLDSGEVHGHIGFYIGEGKAISNSHTWKTPEVHDHKKHRGRKIESIWWHDALNA